MSCYLLFSKLWLCFHLAFFSFKYTQSVLCPLFLQRLEQNMLGPVFPLLLEVIPTKNKVGYSFSPSDKNVGGKLSIVKAVQRNYLLLMIHN